MWFVSVLTGCDNETSYTYVGIIVDNVFRRTKKSKITKEDISFKGFQWLWNTISKDLELPEKVRFYHEGRCGKCGRKLTTPESLECGFGPVCLQIIGCNNE